MKQPRSLTFVPHLFEKADLKYVRCQLGYFNEHIEEQDAILVAKIISRLVLDDELVGIAFYPIDEAVWIDLARQDWTTATEKRFERAGLFRTEKQVLWVMGYPHSTQKLIEVLQFAWNISGNEDVLALAIRESSARQIIGNYRDDLGISQQNEEKLIEHSPLIMSRGADGQWLYIYSARNAPEEMFEIVRALSNDPIVLSNTPL